MIRSQSILLLTLNCGFFVSCMDLSCMRQYDPKPFWSQLKKERAVAHSPKIKLTAAGTLPYKKKPQHNTTPKPSPQIDMAQANKDFTQLCASCHGPQGQGDTPMAQALNPKPRDFSDPKWQKEKSDEHISKVIREGGASVNLSPMMAPWGGLLNEKRINALVAKIRSLKKN